LFFATGSKRILGGTQETLQYLGVADWQSFGADSIESGSEWGRSVADVVDEGAMKTLLAGAEAAFKVSTSQSMKFTKVWVLQ
jgi:hypothetical protein